jgi:peptidoglycan/LPS O-acetylase OafA/YrhL
MVLLWRCYLAAQPGFQVDRTFIASDTRLDSILFGSVFALGFDVTRLPSPQERRPQRDALLFAGGAGIMLLCLLVRGEYFRETVRYTLQGIALMPIFYCAIVYADSPLFRPLNWAWVRRIGVYSYSIYLIHFIVLASLQHSAPFRDSLLLVFAASCAITLLFAELVERFLESRLRELRRKIH